MLSWQHRVSRVRERCRDLLGRGGWRWRVIRTSNAYAFRDPMPQVAGVSSKSGNQTGTGNQEIQDLPAPPVAVAGPVSDALNKALDRLGAALGATGARVVQTGATVKPTTQVHSQQTCAADPARA